MPDPIRLTSATPDVRPGAAPVRLCLADAPERERPRLYREFFGRSVFRLDVEPLDDVPFMADVTLQFLSGLQVFAGRLHGSRNRRTREMLAGGPDHCTLMLNLGGPYIIAQRNAELTLGDGEATFISTAEPVCFAHYPPGGVLALQVPRARLSHHIVDLEDCYMRLIPSGTPALRLLRDYVDIVRSEQGLADGDLQQAVVTHVYDLMAVAVGATPDAAEAAQDRGLRAARLHAIKRDIADNLGQPALSVQVLADRHGLTPRSLQRLFETEGTTFTEYVLAQRLARAHRLLSDPRRAGDKISAVAFDCGFGDVSYFNRVFRRQFGAVPSEIRVQARQRT